MATRIIFQSSLADGAHILHSLWPELPGDEAAWEPHAATRNCVEDASAKMTVTVHALRGQLPVYEWQVDFLRDRPEHSELLQCFLDYCCLPFRVER